MYLLVRKILFLFDPERVHKWVMNFLNLLYANRFLRNIIRKRYTYSSQSLERQLWGINFPNPVGLAAGFDKSARYTDVLSCLGFGFVEIGTLTPVAQKGNPKPRLFRLPADKALINRMGFNNHGVAYAAHKLKHMNEQVIVGGNIGKNKNTPNEEAISDYEKCFEALWDHVDYFVVNVSSPNTPGLRTLQEKEPLTRLLSHLQALNNAKEAPKPICLKIAPDLTQEQLDDIIDIVTTTGIAGIVATNTTIAREGLITPAAKVAKIGNGGLSGKPLRERATEVVAYIHKKSNGIIPIIASGGIFTAEDALEKLQAGATLVQVYTGFIYEGPAIVKHICHGLARHHQRPKKP